MFYYQPAYQPIYQPVYQPIFQPYYNPYGYSFFDQPILYAFQSFAPVAQPYYGYNYVAPDSLFQIASMFVQALNTLTSQFAICTAPAQDSADSQSDDSSSAVADDSSAPADVTSDELTLTPYEAFDAELALVQVESL
jgi:hypothetical protein